MSIDSLRKSLTEDAQKLIETYRDEWNAFGPQMVAGEVTCHDPATGEVNWIIPDLSQIAIDYAVKKSKQAQPKWHSLPAAKKAEVLHACANAILANKEKIAHLLALETGKSLSTECRGEVDLCAGIFKYFAGLVHEIKGKSIQAGPKLLGFTTHHPWGVVAGIVPWNVPLMFMGYKLATPLAAGNSVVIKIPEQATATLLFCRELFRNILPDGLACMVTGAGAGVGTALVSHSGIDKISFTGSVETGRMIYKQAADRLTSATLELGGKSPMVVLEDCDLEKAVEGAFASMRFTRAGQSCTAASRIYVHRNRIDAFRAALGARLDALVIGDPLDDATDCGPVATKLQLQRIQRYLNLANSDKLDIQSYGKQAWGALKGWYLQAHLIFNPDISHVVSQEEIFGPVATVTAYDNIEDVLQAANATPFGLAASVWGKDINACLQLSQGFRAGIVQINQNAVMLPGFSYGGVGISGIGKEGSLEAMLETYTYEKTNIVNFG